MLRSSVDLVDPHNCVARSPTSRIPPQQKKEYIEVRKRTKEESDVQDAEFGFEDFREGPDRLGWLVTYSAVSVIDPDTGAEVSGMHLLLTHGSLEGVW